MLTLRTARAALLAALFAGLTLGAAAQPAPAPAPAKEAKKAKSKLKITVPMEDAELTIMGKPTGQTGKVERVFETPDLEAGSNYEYDFSVTWKPNNYTTITREKTVKFDAGAEVAVDLTKVNDKVADKVVIRWVPTPDDIVAKMVTLAGVKAGDVAYEPGPGDGRVLIAAVKAGAAKAVGIELDKEKAAEAKEAVKKAGLADKIDVREGDALDTKLADYEKASVVFLYMGNEFNGILRPILEKTLKPGTRIVSHRFTMGDWAPDKTEKIKGEDGDDYEIHLWTIKDKK